MGAIQIPSSNIYSIDNQKVIDNEIDRVESGATNVEIVRDYDTTVYSDSMDIGSDDYNKQTYQDQDAWNMTTLPPNDVERSELLGYVSMSLGYFIVNISNIPKVTLQSRIEKIYSSVDKDDEANIKYTIYFDKKTFDITGNGHGISSSKSGTVDNIVTSNEVTTNYSGTIMDENNTQDIATNDTITEEFVITNSTISYEFTRNARIGGYNRTITAKAKAPNASTIKYDNTIVDNGNSYSVRFSVLAYMQKYYLSFKVAGADLDDIPSPRPLKGIGVEYLPKSIEITLYGETINLDLQDETITIGNGNNPISFDGNELMQTTNTPSLETQYQAIIDEWKNGKETAVIRCSIDDYYTDYYGDKKDKAIAVNAQKIYEKVEGQVNALGMLSGSFFVGIGKIRNLRIVPKLGRGTVSYDELTGEISWQIRGIFVGFDERPMASAIIKGDLVLDLPMTFKVGDVVVPYVYGSSGQDKPMSTNSDGTPKSFRVVGKKPIGNGAVWQELTLQETSLNIMENKQL